MCQLTNAMTGARQAAQLGRQCQKGGMLRGRWACTCPAHDNDNRSLPGGHLQRGLLRASLAAAASGPQVSAEFEQHAGLHLKTCYIERQNTLTKRVVHTTSVQLASNLMEIQTKLPILKSCLLFLEFNGLPLAQRDEQTSNTSNVSVRYSRTLMHQPSYHRQPHAKLFDCFAVIWAFLDFTYVYVSKLAGRDVQVAAAVQLKLLTGKVLDKTVEVFDMQIWWKARFPIFLQCGADEGKYAGAIT